MRAVPRRWPGLFSAVREQHSRCGAGGGQDLLGAGDAVLHHAARVLADRVVDPGRRDAVAVLQHGIERDAIVLLRQVVAGDADPHPVLEHLAVDAMMVARPTAAGRPRRW